MANSEVSASKKEPSKLAHSDSGGSSQPKKKFSLKQELISFAWIILVVLCIRAFIIEPYKIPTPSMVPTLLVGDRIFVFKFTYFVGIPFTKIKLIRTGTPKRGDVAIFLYPENESVNFVKRIIGLPGDTIEIRDRKVFVNNHALMLEEISQDEVMAQVLSYHRNPFQKLYLERFPEVEGFDESNTIMDPHYVIHDGLHPSSLSRYFAKRTVPENHYFVMGDNRDRSADSRSWGFVPEENLKGRGAIVWWSINSEKPWTNIFEKIRWRRFLSLVH